MLHFEEKDIIQTQTWWFFSAIETETANYIKTEVTWYP